MAAIAGIVGPGTAVEGGIAVTNEVLPTIWNDCPTPTNDGWSEHPVTTHQPAVLRGDRGDEDPHAGIEGKRRWRDRCPGSNLKIGLRMWGSNG